MTSLWEVLQTSVRYEYAKSRTLIHIPGDVNESLQVALNVGHSVPILGTLTAVDDEIKQMSFVVSLLESNLKEHPKSQCLTMSEFYDRLSKLTREYKDFYFIWRLDTPNSSWKMWRSTLLTLLDFRIKQIVLEPKDHVDLGITSCYSGVTVWRA